MLNRLRKAKLTAKPSKCEIAQTRLQYLGHIVGGGTIQPSTEKLEAIEEAPRPETKKQSNSQITRFDETIYLENILI